MKTEWIVSPRKLARARLDHLLTQDQLSKKSGASLRSIQGYERREQRARLETLQLLAKTLGIEVRDIATLRTIDGDDDARPAPLTRRGLPAPAVLLPRTQLETLVDLERAAGIEPASVETPRGPAQTLTAKGLQDVFTAYALHEGARFCLTGKVEGMRGLAPAEATLLGSRGGVAARFHVLKEVVPGQPVGVTVHTARQEDTAKLQKHYLRTPVTIFVRVVVVPGEPRDDGPGFSSFITRITAKRPWTFVVEEVAEGKAEAEETGDAGKLERAPRPPQGATKAKRTRKS